MDHAEVRVLGGGVVVQPVQPTLADPVDGIDGPDPPVELAPCSIANLERSLLLSPSRWHRGPSSAEVSPCDPAQAAPDGGRRGLTLPTPARPGARVTGHRRRHRCGPEGFPGPAFVRRVGN